MSFRVVESVVFELLLCMLLLVSVRCGSLLVAFVCVCVLLFGLIVVICLWLCSCVVRLCPRAFDCKLCLYVCM